MYRHQLLYRISLILAVLGAVGIGAFVAGFGQTTSSIPDVPIENLPAPPTTTTVPRPSASNEVLTTSVPSPDVKPSPTLIQTIIAVEETALPDVTRAAQKTYVVQRGDILRSIAARHSTTISEILRLNPGINPDSLTVGYTLQLPGSNN